MDPQEPPPQHLVPILQRQLSYQKRRSLVQIISTIIIAAHTLSRPTK